MEKATMDARRKDLVRELLKKDSYATAKSLAQGLVCSERTIQYDVRSVNMHFEGLGIASRVVGRRGLGVRLELAEGERPLVEGLVQSGTFSGYSDLERFVEGMLIIACDEVRACTLESLSKALYASKRQVRRDIRRWSQLLEFFGCSLKIGRSVQLEGDELLLRAALVFLFCSFAPVSMLRDAESRFVRDSLLARRTIERLEEWRGFSFSENAQHSTRFALSLALSRIRGGHAVSFGEGGGTSQPELDHIGRDMAKRVGASAVRGEVRFLHRLCACGTGRFDAPLGESRVEPSREACEIASHLVDAMSVYVDCHEFQEVVDLLVMLVDQALSRRSLCAPVSFRDPFTIKISNMLWYATVFGVIWRLDEMRKLELFGGDIDRMALLTLSAFERSHSYGKCRVALVVNCGIEQVHYARCRLEGLLPDLEIVSLLSDSSLRADVSACEVEVDLVVAFEHVEADVPVCQISFAVDEEDVRRVAFCIAEWRRSMKKDEFGSLACPCSTTRIHPDSLIEVAEAVRQDAVREGIWDPSAELFDYAFNASCVVCGAAAVAVLPLPGVLRTAGRGYVTPPFFVGRDIERFAVLFVAEEDMALLPSIVAQFKESMDIPKTCDVSWEFPVLIKRDVGDSAVL